MSGRYECRIVSSLAEAIVATPKNYSMTREWCEKADGSDRLHAAAPGASHLDTSRANPRPLWLGREAYVVAVTLLQAVASVVKAGVGEIADLGH